MFWIASRPDHIGVWSQAGGSCSATFHGKWYAALPKEQWIFETERDLKEFESAWDQMFGDREQELVLIGQSLDQALLTRMLDDCLLSEKELTLGSDYWQKQTDPFPYPKENDDL
jgi:G3E family GTPase